MATQIEVLQEFELLISILKEHPDKKLILDLTKMCERHVVLSTPLSDMIIARIIDPLTPLNWKLPIFYLIDSVMKHVGGPFPMLFSRHMMAVFQRAYDEVHLLHGRLPFSSRQNPPPFLCPQMPQKEKDRLDFLLGTWEERQLLPGELLAGMRRMVVARKAGVGGPPPAMVSRQARALSACYSYLSSHSTTAYAAATAPPSRATWLRRTRHACAQ